MSTLSSFRTKAKSGHLTVCRPPWPIATAKAPAQENLKYVNSLHTPSALAIVRRSHRSWWRTCRHLPTCAAQVPPDHLDLLRVRAMSTRGHPSSRAIGATTSGGVDHRSGSTRDRAVGKAWTTPSEDEVRTAREDISALR